ncbi:MAG: sugar transferase [Planctomycetaceae bacterium]|nr:sugar transferase [Planctomycetaceae bacterium]
MNRRKSCGWRAAPSGQTAAQGNNSPPLTGASNPRRLPIRRAAAIITADKHTWFCALPMTPTPAHSRQTSFGYFLKRALDVVVSLVALTLTSPLWILTSLWIYLQDFGPIFYRQERMGLDAQPFEALKLRSMQVNNFAVDELGQTTLSSPLVTPAGKFARRFKIDELPQLINVLRGDMTLVGPRPTVRSQVETYTPVQLRRQSVLPGATGWAQINGGIELDWNQRIVLDVWYVDHWSLWLDFKILSRTLGVILFGEKPNPAALAEAEAYARQAYPEGGWGYE